VFSIILLFYHNPVLKSVFPGRKIVGIDVIAINLGGGGIHGITQQEPSVD
jgi:agmatine/peptidylarginine deiminase